MTVIKLAGEDGALNATPSNDQFREQIAALVDAMRQLGGNASIIAGNLAQADPLSAPFTLYVNPYIGSDKFVGGSYNSFEVRPTKKLLQASSSELRCKGWSVVTLLSAPSKRSTAPPSRLQLLLQKIGTPTATRKLTLIA
jgi:hypothetical protein